MAPPLIGQKTADPDPPLPPPVMKPRPGMVAVPDQPLGLEVVFPRLTGSKLFPSPPPLPQAAMKNPMRLDSRTLTKESKLDLFQFFDFYFIPVLLMNLIPPSISHLTFASINCNSLNMSEQSSIHHLIKLYGVVKLKTDIIFMSDIRLCNARGISNSTKIENSFLTNPYCSYRFLSQSHSNKRGVGILIKQKLNLSILQEERDPEDNYLALRVSTGGKEIIIGSIYGPNTHNPGFFDRLSGSLTRLGDVPIVIGGDWNCTYSALPIPDNPDVLNMRSLPTKGILICFSISAQIANLSIRFVPDSRIEKSSRIPLVIL
jgi:hypothetical protein